MILDFHATCGNFPTQGRDWSLDALAHWADLCGVDVLVVESADARLHQDDGPHEQLLAACAGSTGRFLPAASVNLNSDAHSLQVARSARERGFACAVFSGQFFEHSRVLHQALRELGRAPLPVYWELAYDELDAAFRVIREWDDISFVVAPRGFQALELNHRLIGLPNVSLSIARTVYSLGQLETACRRMGAERILHAGDLPGQHPARPLGVVYDAEVSDAGKEMILAGSARRLLAEHGTHVPARGGEAARHEPPCPVIDTHGHIGADYRRPDFDYSVAAVLRFLERAGAETIYISHTEGVFGEVAAGNREVIEAMRAYPERIRGYLVVNPWMGRACLDDVRRCRELGFSGLKPYPGSFGHKLADPVFEPVLALAEEMELPLLCHSSADDLARVLERRPRLKMLAAHMTFEYAEKARLAREYENVVLEISGAGTGVEDIVRAVEIAGEENLVFGSDLNSIGLGFTLEPLLCSGLPERTLRAILRENALRFFGE